MVVKASCGLHRRAAHQSATPSLRPIARLDSFCQRNLATIILSLTLIGFASKALLPGIVRDDFACKLLADPGNATTDDGDDDGKPAPGHSSTASKLGGFEAALLVTIDPALPQSLVLIHGLAVADVAGEIPLLDRYLPNGETGPPVGMRHYAQPIGTAPCPLFSHPLQTFLVVLPDRANQAISSDPLKSAASDPVLSHQRIHRSERKL